MERKVPTNFRLYPEQLDQLDQLAESPPAWLKSCAPGEVKDRTDVIQRLIFLAVKHTAFGLPSDERQHDEPVKRTLTARTQKAKPQRKR